MTDAVDLVEESPEVFDAEEIYQAEIVPLIKQLHAACKYHGIPVMVAVCHSMTEDSCDMGGSVHFIPHRTPPRMHLAFVLMNEEHGPLKVAKQITMAHLARSLDSLFDTGDTEDECPETDTEDTE